LARDYLTREAHGMTAQTMTRWRSLLEELWVKYLDGVVKDEHGEVQSPGYSDAFKGRIVEENGEFLRVKQLTTAPSPHRTITPAGFFHSRAELGDARANVPDDFPFEREKLFLVPGTGSAPVRRPAALSL
jgi:hypothetical protein